MTVLQSRILRSYFTINILFYKAIQATLTCESKSWYCQASVDAGGGACSL